MTSNSNKFYLPDICRNTSILMIVLVVELSAIVLVLSFYAQDFLKNLGLVSVYLLWIVLLAAAVLCFLRKKMLRQNTLAGMSMALAICLTAFVITEVFAQYILYGITLQPFNWERFYRLFIAASIVSLMMLRFFSLLGVMEWRHKVEAQARLQALQSRIKPHFLFNSLNTISELAATNPQQAELAIGSLSTLFRASLDEARNLHTLDSEVHLCKRYLELEKYRLAERLSVTWEISIENTRTWQVPKLILQPLLENAVVHGADENGKVELLVDLRETKNELSIMVVNNRAPLLSQAEREKTGHGIALNNIRERLFVLYDDQQTFKVRDEKNKYQVIMRIPKQAYVPTARDVGSS